jgi:hypothetical protein
MSLISASCRFLRCVLASRRLSPGMGSSTSRGVLPEGKTQPLERVVAGKKSVGGVFRLFRVLKPVDRSDERRTPIA